MKRWELPLFAMVPMLLGCAVGPRTLDAHAVLPPPTQPQRLAPRAGPEQITHDTEVAQAWWQAFASPELDALVDDALHHATDLSMADAALRQAREQAGAVAGSALPQVDASFQTQRARVSNTLAPAVTDATQYLYTLHTAQVTVSYGPDVFGGNRARIRSARAAADVAQYRRDAARAMVVANLIASVIQRASLADQIDAARASVSINQDILQNQLRRQRLGAIGAADIATQETALATAEAALPSLVRAEAHQRVLIGTLLGRAAGSDLPPLPSLRALALPHDVPLALPSELVARRPDVRAARAQLEGAGADVGVAIAARLPNFQLSASGGGAAQHVFDLFQNGNPFWTLLGAVAQPIFHGGALRHQQRAAEAALDGAKAQYRASVLQAFGDVSDALTGLRTDADALDAAVRATDASAHALGYIRRQLALGDVGTLALLNASSADAQARVQLIQARAARLSDTVAMFQAAGGGVVGER